VVGARPNRSRVEFVVLDRLDAGADTARVTVEIRGVTTLADSHDALTPWVGRTMTAVLPSGSPCLTSDRPGRGQVETGYASLVGPGEIRLSPEDATGPSGGPRPVGDAS
jgi:hypothetical protein